MSAGSSTPTPGEGAAPQSPVRGRKKSDPIQESVFIEGGYYSNGYKNLPVDKRTFVGNFESSGISEFYPNRKHKSKAKYWVTRSQKDEGGTPGKYTWTIMFGDAVKYTG